ncbi:endonuclease domain-containing protein [Aureivirga sp. CE67]|uniref:endonuclease domain-containing protein n=1 Tax=Aureivirga sp. CE67 TaxID=1788983 RepID=UPI0018CA171F|nr:DUF559 domain-containing protein [Aureivirga sp. CE67]
MNRNELHNRPELKKFRKELRNNGTTAEAVLWNCLKKKQLGGFKFRRQHSVGNYILDFFCVEKHIAIELDGAHHFTKEGKEKDAIRDAFLNEQEILVLRFENKLIFENQTQVLASILENLLERETINDYCWKKKTSSEE